MTWFRVDDSFYDHPKVKRIPRALRKNTVGLWTLAGSYASKQLTDGFILADDVADLGGLKKEVQALVDVGLWHAPEHDCERCPQVPDGQYLFHDFLIYNPSREKVLAERAATAERQRRAREKAKSLRDKGESNAMRHGVSNAVTDGVSHAEVTPLVTVPPTRPDPTPNYIPVEEGGVTSVTRDTDPPPDHCPQHPPGWPDPCRACADARRTRTKWDRNHATELAKLRDRCPYCHASGWRDGPDGEPTGQKCNHQPETRTA